MASTAAAALAGRLAPPALSSRPAGPSTAALCPAGVARRAARRSSAGRVMAVATPPVKQAAAAKGGKAAAVTKEEAHAIYYDMVGAHEACQRARPPASPHCMRSKVQRRVARRRRRRRRRQHAPPTVPSSSGAPAGAGPRV